jgi:phosphatidylserine/phosphatidylglycerophosphate/cardiolipin synthase-like enzyme
MLRARRDAARRGVRVRVLLDDLYTTGLDPLLLGLAARAKRAPRSLGSLLDSMDGIYQDAFVDANARAGQANSKKTAQDGSGVPGPS